MNDRILVINPSVFGGRSDPRKFYFSTPLSRGRITGCFSILFVNLFVVCATLNIGNQISVI